MTKFEKVSLTIIFLAALILRIFNLGSNPPGFNWDEVSHGYNAYSILKTGADEWGQFFPTTNIRAYGDYPLPLYTYLAIPSIMIFGLNEFAVRLVSAISGSLLVLVVYFLSKRLLDDKKLALFAAFFITISPWSFLLSRQVTQTVLASFFVALGVWLFFKGIRERWVFLLLSTVAFGLSSYGYHNARILSPILILVLIWLFIKELKRYGGKLIINLLVLLLFFLPIIPALLSKEASARATWVTILDQGAINTINQNRSRLTLPEPIPQIIHNKVTYFTTKALTNYLGYFSPRFLMTEGGTQYQLSVPHYGMINPVEAIFFYTGLVFLITKFKRISKEHKFILIWLLLSVVPSAITRDIYQVGRSSLMMPVIPLVAVIGLGWFAKNLKKNLLGLTTVMMISVGLVFFSAYFLNFWSNYPKEYSFAWQYGYKPAVDYVNKEAASYDVVYFTKKYGEPHEFVLFYSQYDPYKYQTNPTLNRYQRSNWYWVDGFDKYHFVNDWEIKEKLQTVNNSLLITSPGNYPSQGKLLETIYFLDHTPAFDIVKLP